MEMRTLALRTVSIAMQANGSTSVWRPGHIPITLPLATMPMVAVGIPMEGTLTSAPLGVVVGYPTCSLGHLSGHVSVHLSNGHMTGHMSLGTPRPATLPPEPTPGILFQLLQGNRPPNPVLQLSAQSAQDMPTS